MSAVGPPRRPAAPPGGAARGIGVVYLLFFLTAIPGELLLRRAGLGGIPLRATSGDAAAITSGLAAHEALFQAGFALTLLSTAGYIALTGLLYRLFRPVSADLALIAACFSLVGLAVQTAASLLQLAPSALAGGSPYLRAFDVEQVRALALLSLDVHARAGSISLVLDGLWLLLLGHLISRSTFLPRLLGAPVALAGLGWAILLWPPLGARLYPAIQVVGVLGEGALMLWLLVVGVNIQRWAEQASGAGAPTARERRGGNRRRAERRALSRPSRRGAPTGPAWPPTGHPRGSGGFSAGGTSMGAAVMTGQQAQASTRLAARVAGVCELLEGTTSAGGQVVIRGGLVVAGDAAATAADILTREPLFWLGFALSLLGVAFHLAWAYLFYELFRPVHRTVAGLAAFVILVGCALQAAAALLYLAPLLVLRSGSASSAFSAQQVQALALLFLEMNARAYDIYLVFFGLWCVLIGYLIVRSTFMPRLIGLLLALDGLGWVTYLYPPLATAIYPVIAVAAALGEFPLLLWLLVVGVNEQRWRAQAGPAAFRP